MSFFFLQRNTHSMHCFTLVVKYAEILNTSIFIQTALSSMTHIGSYNNPNPLIVVSPFLSNCTSFLSRDLLTLVTREALYYISYGSSINGNHVYLYVSVAPHPSDWFINIWPEQHLHLLKRRSETFSNNCTDV